MPDRLTPFLTRAPETDAVALAKLLAAAHAPAAAVIPPTAPPAPPADTPENPHGS